MNIQQRWQNLQLLGYDAILYADGTVTLADISALEAPAPAHKQYFWHSIADTHIDSIDKYDHAPWVHVDIFHGAINHDNQRIVFGDGAMEDDGFVASTTPSGALNWAIFFSFSGPIRKAEVVGDSLLCYSDADLQISINLRVLHDITIGS